MEIPVISSSPAKLSQEQRHITATTIFRQLKTNGKYKNNQLILGAAGTKSPPACFSEELAADAQENGPSRLTPLHLLPCASLPFLQEAGCPLSFSLPSQPVVGAPTPRRDPLVPSP